MQPGPTQQASWNLSASLSRLSRAVSISLLPMLLWLAPGTAAAHDSGRKGAVVVETQPVAVTAGYDFELSDIDRPGFRSGTEHRGSLELRIPLPDPVPPFVGLAFGVDGLKQDRSLEPGPDFDARGYGVQAEAFWRDPSQGFFRLIYRFDRLDRDIGALANDRDRHSGELRLGVYHGRFDVEGFGRYRRIENDVALVSDPGIPEGEKIDGEYAAGAEAGVYPHPTTRLALGAEWTHVPSNAFDPREVEGVFTAEFQPPFGTKRYARVGVDASFGHLWTDEAGIASSNFYTLGVFVRFDWPGSVSLQQQKREYGF